MIDVIICLIGCLAMLIAGSTVLWEEIIEAFKKWGDTNGMGKFQSQRGRARADQERCTRSQNEHQRVFALADR